MEVGKNQQNYKVCFRCRKFTGYYTKGVKNFDRTKNGFCREQNKIVENISSCDCWENGAARLFANEKRAIKILSGLLENITAVKQVLIEAEEEAKKANERGDL